MLTRRRLGWRVPILMYHRVVEDHEPSPYFFSITRTRFERQMRALRALRCSAVTPEQVADWLERGRPLPPRPVSITFDDGYADTYHLAAPILERWGFRAALFLVSDRVGAANDWDEIPGSGPMPLMGWDEARDLARRGFTLGSHTRTHRPLVDLDAAELREEVIGSRESLERRLGMPVRLFAYPKNRTDARCQEAVRAAGYRAACAGDARGYHPWCLDRVDVSRSSLPVFLAKVSPWFYASRRARQRLFGLPTGE